jgi:hypothetical protein
MQGSDVRVPTDRSLESDTPDAGIGDERMAIIKEHRAEGTRRGPVLPGNEVREAMTDLQLISGRQIHVRMACIGELRLALPCARYGKVIYSQSLPAYVANACALTLAIVWYCKLAISSWHHSPYLTVQTQRSSASTNPWYTVRLQSLASVKYVNQ